MREFLNLDGRIHVSELLNSVQDVFEVEELLNLLQVSGLKIGLGIQFKTVLQGVGITIYNVSMLVCLLFGLFEWISLYFEIFDFIQETPVEVLVWCCAVVVFEFLKGHLAYKVKDVVEVKTLTRSYLTLGNSLVQLESAAQ